jgi:hypothetical protein
LIVVVQFIQDSLFPEINGQHIKAEIAELLEVIPYPWYPEHNYKSNDS